MISPRLTNAERLALALEAKANILELRALYVEKKRLLHELIRHTNEELQRAAYDEQRLAELTRQFTQRLLDGRP